MVPVWADRRRRYLRPMSFITGTDLLIDVGVIAALTSGRFSLPSG